MNSEAAPPRVLLVDDEVDFLDNLHQRLELRGMPTLKASSGAEALATLENEDVDVVVLDVRMPGMDGIETLRRIKEDHPRIEVVMLTGHADLESSLEGMRFGFFDYLTKPVQIETLVSKIRDAHHRRTGNGTNIGETFSGKLKQHMVVADRLASLGELAGSIAHEINNPLAIIAESSGWLKTRFSRADGIPEQVEADAELALDKIEKAVDRARRISQNFLRFSRSPDAIVRDTNLEDLAAEVVELTGKTAYHHGVSVAVISEPEAITSLLTDPFQLRQVLLNLVTNAIQAVPKGGQVSLRLGGDDHEVSVAVEDNGPGIPEENIERVFEPFFTTKPEGQGTGLGLAVSRGIVERLGGRIEIDNRPGEGCTFRVVVPRSPIGAAQKP
jgi:signal transduction histidine kinase